MLTKSQVNARKRWLTHALSNVDMRATRDGACHVVDSVQHLRREEQVAGLAVTFLLVCEYLGLEPREVLPIAENIIRRVKGRNYTHLDGLRMYFAGWLKEII